MTEARKRGQFQRGPSPARIYLKIFCSLLAAAAALEGLVACQTPSPPLASAQSEIDTLETLKAATIVPEAFLPIGAARPGQSVAARVPKNMVAISAVIRPRAEVRLGPGSQFELTNLLLPEGSRVLVFQQIGVWRQVLVPPQWQRGWIHYQALSPPKLNLRPVDIDLKRLPTVLALRSVLKAQSFPEQKPLKVEVPKGSMFHSLQISAQAALVWLPETNSVMWLSRKDVQ